MGCIVAHLLDWFRDAGLLVNLPKYYVDPVQNLVHFGLELDFIKGCVSIPGRKLKYYRKELGNLVTHGMVTCRRAAAILRQASEVAPGLPCLTYSEVARVRTEMVVSAAELDRYLHRDD